MRLVIALFLLLGSQPPNLPNPTLTPGATLPVTAAQVCVPGYSRRVRHVPESEKRAVYREYGIVPNRPFCCEVDHLVSLELGGSNDIRNLWPEPYLPLPGARQKDQVEDYLHRQVCAGRLSLAKAQSEIRTDWLTVYLSLRPK